MSTELHPSIVALVSLAAKIAVNHPGQGLCQIDQLRHYGVSDEQVDLVIEIARHIRDEAAQKLDVRFDDALAGRRQPAGKPLDIPVAAAASTCCTPTAGAQPCC
jgi:hypothetical protein